MRASVLMVSVLLGSSAAYAQGSTPMLLNHQGRLLDSKGVPVNNAQSVKFSLYAVAQGGAPLWSETQTIAFNNGNYGVSLGAVTALSPALFGGATLYLGIAVGSDAEMTPRQPVTSVPYAIAATNVIGDITPKSVTVGGTKVIDASGKWVGAKDGLAGPAGPPGQAHAWSGSGYPGQARPQADGVVARLSFQAPVAGFVLASAQFGIRVQNGGANCQVRSQLASVPFIPADLVNCTGDNCAAGYTDSWVNANLPTQEGIGTYLTLNHSASRLLPVNAGSNTIYLNGSYTCNDAIWGPITLNAVFVQNAPASTFSVP
jgi:hypothetical protein